MSEKNKPIPKCSNCDNDEFYLLKVNFGFPEAFDGSNTASSGIALRSSQNVGDYLLGICSKCDVCILKKASYWHVN